VADPLFTALHKLPFHKFPGKERRQFYELPAVGQVVRLREYYGSMLVVSQHTHGLWRIAGDDEAAVPECRNRSWGVRHHGKQRQPTDLVRSVIELVGREAQGRQLVPAAAFAFMLGRSPSYRRGSLEGGAWAEFSPPRLGKSPLGPWKPGYSTWRNPIAPTLQPGTLPWPSNCCLVSCVGGHASGQRDRRALLTLPALQRNGGSRATHWEA
jgi:hypothetical protein